MVRSRAVSIALRQTTRAILLFFLTLVFPTLGVTAITCAPTDTGGAKFVPPPEIAGSFLNCAYLSVGTCTCTYFHANGSFVTGVSTCPPLVSFYGSTAAPSSSTAIPTFSVAHVHQTTTTPVSSATASTQGALFQHPGIIAAAISSSLALLVTVGIIVFVVTHRRFPQRRVPRYSIETSVGIRPVFQLSANSVLPPAANSLGMTPSAAEKASLAMEESVGGEVSRRDALIQLEDSKRRNEAMAQRILELEAYVEFPLGKGLPDEPPQFIVLILERKETLDEYN
ncbi:hypothetical protein C8R43DRAFT_1242442 [Mycena crocata]|nr:hypothetical protein C8R43DRAFT_1242442 [Mycena crocata]